MAENHGIRFLETSAKKSHNIDQAFTLLATEIYFNRIKTNITNPPVNPV